MKTETLAAGDKRACYVCGHPADAHPMVPDPRGGMKRGDCPAASAPTDTERLDKVYRLAMVEPFIAPIATKEKWIASIDAAIAKDRK